jgi:hypothetical protein
MRRQGKEIARMLSCAEEQGFRVERTRRGHYMVYAPDGVGKCLLSSGGGCPRETRNSAGHLRRIGVRV